MRYILCFQIFEWWYFKKYGTSFIEQVSLNHISPLLGGGSETTTTETASTNGTSNTQQQSVPGIPRCEYNSKILGRVYYISALPLGWLKNTFF